MSYIKRDWKLFSEQLRWFLIGSETDFGMNRNKCDWFGINFNPRVLPGRYLGVSKITDYKLECITPKFEKTDPIWWTEITKNRFRWNSVHRRITVAVAKTINAKIP